MIVCSCNVLSCRDIRRGVETILEVDLHALVTPGKVYGSLGCRLRCGGCMPNSVAIIHAHMEKIRGERICGGDCSVCRGERADVRGGDRVSEAA